MSTPTQTYFGNQLLYVGDTSTFIMNSVANKIALRFRAKGNRRVSTIVILADTAFNDVSVRVGIQEDLSGRPSGQWLANYQADCVTGGRYFKTDVATGAVALRDASIYYVVVEFLSSNGGEIDYLLMKSPLAAGCYFYPDGVVNDASNVYISSDSGATWSEGAIGNSVCGFALIYPEGDGYGFPYSSLVAFHETIGIGTEASLSFTMKTKLTVKSLQLSISKGGIGVFPVDPLLVDFTNVTDSTLIKTFSIEAAAVIADPTVWCQELTFDSPVTLYSGKEYSITLSSNGNNYGWYGNGWDFEGAMNEVIEATWPCTNNDGLLASYGFRCTMANRNLKRSVHAL